MSTYVVGDLQGCLSALKALLDQVAFDHQQDELWCVGDLINRGPESLACLRFLKNMGPRVKVVLGNHDLHFLAVAAGLRQTHKSDTLSELLTADDLPELLLWLRQQPLVYADKTKNAAMVHAGIPPQWTIDQALAYSQEVQTKLSADDYLDLIANMYGKDPNSWSNDLEGWPRSRYIINAFTRMRFLNRDLSLEFSHKDAIAEAPQDLLPWFSVVRAQPLNLRLCFGHWSTLHDIRHGAIFALDSGCVWGGGLTAFRLEDEQLFTVDCSQFSSVRP